MEFVGPCKTKDQQIKHFCPKLPEIFSLEEGIEVPILGSYNFWKLPYSKIPWDPTTLGQYFEKIQLMMAYP